MFYFKDEIDPINNSITGIGPAHRIDRNTSGLIIFGKNISALHLLVSYRHVPGCREGRNL